MPFSEVLSAFIAWQQQQTSSNLVMVTAGTSMHEDRCRYIFSCTFINLLGSLELEKSRCAELAFGHNAHLSDQCLACNPESNRTAAMAELGFMTVLMLTCGNDHNLLEVQLNYKFIVEQRNGREVQAGFEELGSHCQVNMDCLNVNAADVAT
jgi:hypothetical protein